MIQVLEKIALAILVFLVTFLFTTLINQVDNQEIKEKVKELQATNLSLQNKLDSVETELYMCSDDLNNYQVNLLLLKDEYPRAARRYDWLINRGIEIK